HFERGARRHAVFVLLVELVHLGVRRSLHLRLDLVGHPLLFGLAGLLGFGLNELFEDQLVDDLPPRLVALLFGLEQLLSAGGALEITQRDGLAVVFGDDGLWVIARDDRASARSAASRLGAFVAGTRDDQKKENRATQQLGEHARRIGPDTSRRNKGSCPAF